MTRIELNGNQLFVPEENCTVRLPGSSVPIVYVNLASGADEFARRILKVECPDAGCSFVWPRDALWVGARRPNLDPIPVGVSLYEILQVNGVQAIVRLDNVASTPAEAALSLLPPSGMSTPTTYLGLVDADGREVELDVSQSRSFLLDFQLEGLATLSTINWPETGTHMCWLHCRRLTNTPTACFLESEQIQFQDSGSTFSSQSGRWSLLLLKVEGQTTVQAIVFDYFDFDVETFEMTVATTYPNQQVQLPVLFGSFFTYDMWIDWGDGQGFVNQINGYIGSGDGAVAPDMATFNYPDPGTYKITIRTALPLSLDSSLTGFSGWGYTFTQALRSIDKWCHMEVAKFRNCEYLETVAPIPAGYLPANCEMLFSGCISLSLNLAEHDFTGVRILDRAFASLTFSRIPAEFNAPNLVSGYEMFSACIIDSFDGRGVYGAAGRALNEGENPVDLAGMFRNTTIRSLTNLNFIGARTTNLLKDATNIEELTVIALDNILGDGQEYEILELGSGTLTSEQLNAVYAALVDNTGYPTKNFEARSHTGFAGSDTSIADDRNWFPIIPE